MPVHSVRPWLRAPVALLALAAIATACGGPPPTAVPGTASLAGGATAVPPPAGRTVSPPSAIDASCASDVSASLQTWLNSLAPSRAVVLPKGSCYLVDQGIVLVRPHGLTIYGGTLHDGSSGPAAGAGGKGHPALTVVGGSQFTLESMRITGTNGGGYHPRAAFAGGIELEGTDHATIRGVTVSRTFGDGITLAPLRGGADHNSGHIVAPTSAATIRDVTVQGVGRQGLTFASVAGASVTDVVVDDPGLDTFDFEADQGDEGAQRVTIDGCAASGGILFFANGGAGGGSRTGDITVEHCTMAKAEGGSAVLVQGRRHATAVRGPFRFVADDLWCGASAYVACIQLSGAAATLNQVTLHFRGGTTHEAVYHLVGGSHAVFTDVSATGFGRPGAAAPGSVVTVSGGRWSPM